MNRKKVKKSKHKKKQKQGLIKTLKCSEKQEALVKSSLGYRTKITIISLKALVYVYTASEQY